MNRRQKIIALYHNLFNLKFALMSVVVNGGIALILNWAHGPKEYLMAGLAGATAGFLSTGVTARVVQHFSPLRSALKSYFWGSLAPASLTFTLYLLAHLWNHTPEMVSSCVAPTLLSFITSFGTNFVTRRGYLLPGNYPQRKP